MGATSPIARAMADDLARRGDHLFLAGRDGEEVTRVAADLRTRRRTTIYHGNLEADPPDGHAAFLQEAIQQLGGIDGAVFAVGHLGEQPAESIDPEGALRLIRINLSAAVSLLGRVSNTLEEQGSGFIMGLSSVAGDRGRRSNYAYAAAKAGLSVYLDGLRHRLDAGGVRVFTLKLGFVDTGMTYGKPGLFLVASPGRIARRAVRILERSSGTYYLPGFWRPLMWIIRQIPEPVFKRLDL